LSVSEGVVRYSTDEGILMDVCVVLCGVVGREEVKRLK
jgi:hypothetical protein